MHINNWLRDINNGYEICYKKNPCEIERLFWGFFNLLIYLLIVSHLIFAFNFAANKTQLRKNMFAFNYHALCL